MRPNFARFFGVHDMTYTVPPHCWATVTYEVSASVQVHIEQRKKDEAELGKKRKEKERKGEEEKGKR